MQRILVVDDDGAIRGVLRELLEEEGYDVSEAADGADVQTALAGTNGARPDLVLMDVRMPDKGGLDVLRETGRPTGGSHLPVIIMTAFGGSSVAIEAMQLGAYDYITKPFDLEDVLLTVQRFFERQQLTEQVHELSSRLGERDPNEVIIGNSAAMQDVYKTIGRVARSDATVLITGETGTGKELVATVLHRSSSYSRGPLVKVNCAALPETLLESELFGHEKGSFTGALAQRKGRFEMANKGTIFLDEVGEMSLATQKKLLRVLQEREFERVGGSISVKIDTRVIAATNKVLSHEIEQSRFREDLYYRLNVVSIETPPLRERKEDITALATFFLRRFAGELKKRVDGVAPDALKLLMRYNWPGNIRELENAIERGVLMTENAQLTSVDLRLGELSTSPSSGDASPVIKIPPTGIALEEIERQAIVEALKMSNWVQKDAAELLAISPRVMNYKIKTLGIDYARGGRRPMISEDEYAKTM